MHLTEVRNEGLPCLMPSIVGCDGMAALNRVNIAGATIAPLGFEAVAEEIMQRVKQKAGPLFVVPTNAQHVGLLHRDVRLREVFAKAFLAVPDGVPLLWAAELLKSPLPGRVNGTNLFVELCQRAATGGYSVYLLGGRPQSAVRAAAELTRRNPSLMICGTYCPPYGFERDPVENSRIVAQINAAQPDLLFVGFGVPKQEYWLLENAPHLRATVSVCIGGSFEIVAGIVRRAPQWMQDRGLEWFFRLLIEPRRLWKRYMVGNLQFCLLVARQYVHTLPGLAHRGEGRSTL